jgi:uncharacterized Zn finger protein
MARKSSSPDINAQAQPRFEIAALRWRASEPVFARGHAYYDDDRVDLIAVDARRVLARVAGTESYRTTLRGRAAEFSGECTCPAFEGTGFCKHLVATALAVNAAPAGELEEAASRLPRLRAHLIAQGVEALADMILEFAEDDDALMRRLELAALTEQADDDALRSRLLQMIEDATATPDYVPYGGAGDWADGVHAVLDAIEKLLARERAQLAIELLDELFDRLEDAVEAIDDSDGEVHVAAERATELHRAACGKAQLDPVALARDLFARETGSDWDWFYRAEESYAELLGEAGTAEYRRLAEAAAGTPEAKGGSTGDQVNNHRAFAILDRCLERDGEIDRRIALRVKDLSSPYAYQQLAELCLEHGREAEALKWTDEGLWRFEDRPNRPLTLFAIDLYQRAGRADAAEELLWKDFEALPGAMTYQKLKAGAEGRTAEIADRAIASLVKRLGPPRNQRPRPAWGAPDGDLLVPSSSKRDASTPLGMPLAATVAPMPRSKSSRGQARTAAPRTRWPPTPRWLSDGLG